MTVAVLAIPYLPPSPNQLRGAHWSRARGAREAAGWAVRAAWNVAGRPKANGRRATLELAVYAPGTADDADNRLARLKPLIDALVYQGVLVDDRPAWLTIAGIPTRHPCKRGDECVVARVAYHESTTREEPRA